MADTIPPDNRVAGDPNHLVDHTNIADTMGLHAQTMAQLLGVNNPAGSGNSANIAALQAYVALGKMGAGIQPSGDTTGATDTANIQAALTAQAGGAVLLANGSFYTNAPLSIPAHTALIGTTPTGTGGGSSTQDMVGTTIFPVASFSMATTPAGIPAGVLYVNGWSTSLYRTSIVNLWINGTNAPAGLSGVTIYGGAFHGGIINCGIWGMPQNGMTFINNGSNRADGWIMRDLLIENYATNPVSAPTPYLTTAAKGYGIQWYGQDLQAYDVHVQAANGSTTTGAAWWLTNASNCRFFGCRGDQSGDSGWIIDSPPGGTPTNPDGSVIMVGCGSQSNQYYGLYLINSSTANHAFLGTSLRTPVVCTNYSSIADGRSGAAGQSAAFAVQGVNCLELINCDITSPVGSGASPLNGLITIPSPGTGGTPGVPTWIRAQGGLWSCTGQASNPPELIVDNAGVGSNLLVDVDSIVAQYAAVTTPAFPATTNGSGTTNTVTNTYTSSTDGGTITATITQPSGATITAVYVNGVSQSLGSWSSPQAFNVPAGETISIAWSGSPTPTWTWTPPFFGGWLANTPVVRYQSSASSGLVYNGLFGDGSDSAVTLDGTTTYTSFATLTSPGASGVYTLTRDVFCTALTVENGITLNRSGFRVFCTGTIDYAAGSIAAANGNNASGSTGGAATTSGSIQGGAAGATGLTTGGVTGGGAGSAFGVGASGAGGSGGGGGTGSGHSANGTTAPYRSPGAAMSGVTAWNAASKPVSGAAGGGSGAGDGSSNTGGGGGSGAGIIIDFAHAITIAGTIECIGGNGASPAAGNAGGGGGGGGGVYLSYSLTAPTITGTITLTGGTGAAGTGTGTAGTSGNAGSYLNVVIQ